jgi:hypothetical protein
MNRPISPPNSQRGTTRWLTSVARPLAAAIFVLSITGCGMEQQRPKTQLPASPPAPNIAPVPAISSITTH